jgi:hypothetical protein
MWSRARRQLAAGESNSRPKALETHRRLGVFAQQVLEDKIRTLHRRKNAIGGDMTDAMYKYNI